MEASWNGIGSSEPIMIKQGEENLNTKIDLDGSPEYASIHNEYASLAKQLGITPTMEKALFVYLSKLGVLDYCAAPDGSCTGDCPDGQNCISLINMNCACSTRFKRAGNKIVLNTRG